MTHSMVIAVVEYHSRVPTLYRVDQTRHATKLPSLKPPRFARSYLSVQMDRSADPTVCVSFQPDVMSSHPNEVWCYPPGDNVGEKVASFKHEVRFSMSADGHHVALTASPSYGGGVFVLGTLTAGTLIHDYSTKFQNEGDCAVVGPTWVGGADILFDCLPNSEESGGLVATQSIDAIRTGATPGDGTILLPRGGLGKGYDDLSGPTLLDDSTAIGIERAKPKNCHGPYDNQTCDPSPVEKAVVFDIHTGKILDVVAFPAAGRYLNGVSGGSHGLVYVTRDNGYQDMRVYVRWPGEANGVRVTGLPSQFSRVIAQH